MDIEYKLTDKDIIGIIAEHFGAPKNKVILCAKEVWRGYGPTEHRAYEISATVTVKEE